MSNKYLPYVIFTTFLLIMSPAANAHILLDHGHTWVIGFMHPFLGIDHLLTMLAVGLWSAQQGGNRLWQLPSAFLGMMLFGAVAGTQLPLPEIETGILGSVLILSLMLMLAVRLPVMLNILLVGFFALFHGYAHGAEMPASLSVLSFSGGFLASTAILLSVGIGLGTWLRSQHYDLMLRISGLAITITGGLLWT